MNGEVPHPEHATLTLWLESRADRAAQAWAVGGEVVGEECNGEDIEDDPNNGGSETDRIVRNAGELFSQSIVGEHLVSGAIQADRFVDVVLQPLLDLIDKDRRVIDQSG